MVCIACRRPMIVVEYKKIELDFCPNCHGSWFDHDELALMLESVTGHEQSLLIQNLLAQPAVSVSERKRKCPVCGTKMKNLRIGQQTGILLDACENGDGLWFDGGEIDQFVKIAENHAPVKAEQDHVFDFMQEVYKNPISSNGGV